MKGYKNQTYYFVNTNSYTKFNVNILKNSEKKSGKLILTKEKDSCKSIL